MTAVPIGIMMTEELRADMSKRAWARFMREGNEKVGNHWHEKLLPKHFRRAARNDYRHAPRKPDYQRKKEILGRYGIAKYGGQVDNVLSGDLEEQMRRARTVRAYPTRATVTLSGPRHMTMTPRGGGPNKFAEVSAMTPTDEAELMDVLADHVSERFNKHRDPRASG